MKKLNIVCSVILIILCSIIVNAQKVEYLWPQGAPGAKGDADGDKPTITYFLPDSGKTPTTAVLICPGGAYMSLASGYEGEEIARWFNKFGVAGIVLKYRHARSGAGYQNPVPLNDARRAMSFIRSRAQELNINPGKIGVMGFSAGGHLASSLATHYTKDKKDSSGPVDMVSCRPDFEILIYPVITMNYPFVNKGSRENLLGNNPEQSLLDNMSNELHVDSLTPPAFIVHTTEDKEVPVENSIMFYSALRKAGVPAEIHIFQKGSHGFGLGEKGSEASAWPDLCRKWMLTMGLL